MNVHISTLVKPRTMYKESWRKFGSTSYFCCPDIVSCDETAHQKKARNSCGASISRTKMLLEREKYQLFGTEAEKKMKVKFLAGYVEQSLKLAQRNSLSDCFMNISGSPVFFWTLMKQLSAECRKLRSTCLEKRLKRKVCIGNLAVALAINGNSVKKAKSTYCRKDFLVVLFYDR